MPKISQVQVTIDVSFWTANIQRVVLIKGGQPVCTHYAWIRAVFWCQNSYFYETFTTSEVEPISNMQEC